MAGFTIDTTIDEVMTRFGDSVSGKTFIITGPSTQSLGAAAAIGLARGNPKRLILVGRSLSKIQPVLDAITSASPTTTATFVEIDLLSLPSVRNGAKEILSLTSEDKGIHGLINCAGIMAVRTYQESADGIESQFAVNHVAHFLLTNLLRESLSKVGGVVVNVSSSGYELADIDYEDVNFGRGERYNSWEAYAQSKTANLLFTVALARRGVVAFGVNPGLVVETSLQANSNVSPEHFMEGVALYKARNEGQDPPIPTVVSLAQGAATIVLPIVDPSLREKSGTALRECQDWEIKEYAKNPARAEMLWTLSEKLVKQEFAW